MFHNHPRNILDLPFEIIVKIVKKLPYTDVQSVRLTCWVFNNAGMYVQKTALHKMKQLADSALDMCHTGFNINTNNTNDFRAYQRALRMLKGLASVNCLAGIIRVTDASTNYFLLDGSLPPVPCVLLTDLEEALSIATKRNPLVGRDRLKRIFASFDRYLTMAMNSLHSPLKMTSVFRSVIDLLACIPHKTYMTTHEPYGIYCLICLRSLTIMFSRNQYYLTAPLLIRLLAKLNVKGIEALYRTLVQEELRKEYIRMENVSAEEIQTVYTTIDQIELIISCRPEQSEGVWTLKQICHLEPTDFKLFLRQVPRSTAQPKQCVYNFFPGFRCGSVFYKYF